MSEITPDDLQTPDDTQSVGQTSTERDNNKGGFKFTIYEGMLLVSLICILLAILIMYLEISSFGSIGSFPWRVEEAIIDAPSQ